MRLILCACFIFSLSAFADIGRILQSSVGKDAFILRAGKKIFQLSDLSLELGDEIHSEGSRILIHIYPANQLSLGPKSILILSEHSIKTTKPETLSSVIGFQQGLVRFNFHLENGQEIDHKIRADGIVFVVRGTEFEISSNENQYDLEVSRGQVEVSSPFIQSFVPEIITEQRSLRFDRKKHVFLKKKFQPKFNNYLRFRDPANLLKSWRGIKK